MNVALFITCLTDQFYPRVGVAVTKILRHLGCTVSFPAAQTCCGQPFYNNGFHDDAAQLAKRFVGIFEPYEFIVTPSGSCCAMVRQHFPHLLGHDHAWEHGMQNVAFKTYEFAEFLEKILKVDLAKYSLPTKISATYHYTCHLRGLGIDDTRPKMLSRMGNLEMRPLTKADQCCGFGGTFAVKYPAISGAIARDKASSIQATSASITLCDEAGCSMNIAGMCHREGVETRVVHFAELLAEAMGLSIDSFEKEKSHG